MASLSSLLSLSPYPRSKNQSSNLRNKKHGVNYVPCRASNGDQAPMNSNLQGGDSLNKFDRRDMLFGLGGLYGVATLSSNRPVLAEPLSPDVANCSPAKTPAGMMDCCPPKIKDIIDFIPPVIPTPRVRPAAHLITPDQLANFEKAIDLMKRLDKHDPRNFYQQANVHCAYCNKAYKEFRFPEVDLEVHWNALFFPFHRAYLYFFERILGHLIGDPTFAIPFWNWDSKPGMQMPKIYNNPNSSLYDELRDARHKPPKLVYLNYDGTEDPPFDVVDCNYRWMNKQMSVEKPEDFLGKLLKGGEEADQSGMGTIENSPHNNIHDWVGDPNCKHHEDMGTFYSAARDPLFYGHHANVDRMWSIWQKMGKVPRDYTNDDWLQSSFVLYDEHKNAVRIKVCHCLDSVKLGYVYQDVDIPWLKTKRFSRSLRKSSTKESEPSSSSTEAQAPPPIISFPLVLDSNITTMVQRPDVPRTGKQKREENEVLVIEDIEFDTTSRVHFNVLVNVLDDGSDVCPGNIEFVGSFRNIPHGLQHRGKTSLRFVITELIEELGLEKDEALAVKIDPKIGGDGVSIGGIKIQLEPIN